MTIEKYDYAPFPRSEWSQEIQDAIAAQEAFMARADDPSDPDAAKIALVRKRMDEVMSEMREHLWGEG